MLLQIEELENKILLIEDKIVEEDLNQNRSVSLEFFIYLSLVISLVTLMFFFNGYLAFWTLLIFLISILFVFYYLSCYRERRQKEDLVNSLISEKFNLETRLESIPRKQDLEKNIKLINNKRV